MYVCTYVYMYVCTYVFIMFISEPMHVHRQSYIHVCTYVLNASMYVLLLSINIIYIYNIFIYVLL